MAAGAVGGYFGARLAAAGHDVSFIARGAHLDAIRSRGLRLESPLGNLHISDAKATAEPREVGEVDIVLFAVKLWDTEIAGAAARPLVGAGTRVITFQNGVDSVERLQPILGKDQVVGGTTHIASVISAPGVIAHTSQFALMRCGHVDGRADPALAALVAAARAAGIEASLSDDIDLDRWKKFTFLVGLSGATGMIRMPLGPILADQDTRAFFLALMQEVVAVGRAGGVKLPPDFAQERLAFADTTPPGFKASLLHDLERGNRIELDWLAGKVVELGRSRDIPTPANAAVYAALKLHRAGHS
ncbi:MAG TPA: ketopantoate reductase family protein [Xanthobacteraceae bacterium]